MQIRKHTYFRFLITIVVLILFSYGANAQFGILKGRVTDKETKKPIPFVNLTFDIDENKINTFVTDLNGDFYIDSIPAGICRLQLKHAGYNTALIVNIKMKPDTLITFDVSLEVAYYLKMVEINTGVPEIISKDNTTSGQEFDEYEIKKMAW